MGRNARSGGFGDIGYVCLDLNEGNVQDIFNRCLATEDSREITRTTLFSTLLGYSEEEEIILAFDKAALLQNKKNIEYLYGQLSLVHAQKHLNHRLSPADFSTAYQGGMWCSGQASLLKLLYLGCNNGTAILSPFHKAEHDTAVMHNGIKPTLSPKDPSFPAWWEAHKAEWEK